MEPANDYAESISSGARPGNVAHVSAAWEGSDTRTDIARPTGQYEYGGLGALLVDPLRIGSSFRAQTPDATAVPDVDFPQAGGVNSTTSHLHPKPSNQEDHVVKPQFRKIAPNPINRHKSAAPSRSVLVGNTTAVRRKRSAFTTTSLRTETSLTRTLNACIKCRVLRNRCSLDPTNLEGPCLTCNRTASKITILPCLRYKIVDSNLYRTTFHHFEFFRLHTMVGPTYGDFHIVRQWTEARAKVIEVAQDSNIALQLRVKEFVPTAEELLSDDTRGNKMFSIPWAIADPDEAAASVNCYIDRCTDAYLETVLDDTNHLVWDVFLWASRLSVFPEPNALLSNVVRLWVVCRFLEGRWRCSRNDNLDAGGLKQRYDRNPIVQVPPFINYQMAAIFTERILQPLRVTILKQLQALIMANKTSNWFVIFISVFILLHNYELQCKFHRAFSRRRKFPLRFVDMPIIRAIHSGAKTILAHFHYCCKGQRPFNPETNWDSPHLKEMALLDDEKIRFLKRYRTFVQQKAAELQAISQTHDYEDEFWFTSQLYDPAWVPRQTNEHSLPAEIL